MDVKNQFLIVLKPKIEKKASIKSVFNCFEAKNQIKSINQIGFFKFRESGAKHVQHAIHRVLQELQIEKQHVPQLIVV